MTSVLLSDVLDSTTSIQRRETRSEVSDTSMVMSGAIRNDDPRAELEMDNDRSTNVWEGVPGVATHARTRGERGIRGQLRHAAQDGEEATTRAAGRDPSSGQARK
jgi:hypothetical protein